MKKKVVVGMSGGVDSSVAAYLLKEQGYDIIGVTLQLWQEADAHEESEKGRSCGFSAGDDAGRVCEMLGIPHVVVDFRPEFREAVVDYFISEYQNGRTPNPCIVCNRYIKWEALIRHAATIGADYIATGHYARIIKVENGRYTVSDSVAVKKDQTYVLYSLTQEQLARTLMPLGEYEKPQIRRFAEELALPVAAKHDSQDICFIPDKDYAGFIERETGRVDAAGNFVDVCGTVMGTHCGISHYTVGQRKGLGISYSEPLFVKEICCKTNEVVLCKATELFSDSCIIENVNYMAVSDLQNETRALGKIRYSHQGAECVLTPLDDGRLKCRFFEPQRAITPGQTAVFYENGYILCGGIINCSS